MDRTDFFTVCQDWSFKNSLRLSYLLHSVALFDIRYSISCQHQQHLHTSTLRHTPLQTCSPTTTVFVSSALPNGNRIHPPYRGCRPPGLRGLLDHQTQPGPPPAWSKALSYHWQPPQLPPRSFLRRIHKMAKRVRCGQILHYTALQYFESLKCPNAPTQVMSSTPTSLVNPST